MPKQETVFNQDGVSILRVFDDSYAREVFSAMDSKYYERIAQDIDFDPDFIDDEGWEDLDSSDLFEQVEYAAYDPRDNQSMFFIVLVDDKEVFCCTSWSLSEETASELIKERPQPPRVVSEFVTKDWDADKKQFITRKEKE